ncbi:MULTISPECIES: MBL fold metallo-hydrolase [unclassified Chelatococcus]|uniref:MBL fold metallo-hydrolase n=1 Tax=unclassified Chelatococcus TaxID=2638111 RepID=UPI001BCDAC16|nr:MBL fold metallo-hydrolase [Chelatococcus sp.]MBS7742633.1 MBL fold metallo-hydrolase [Chelatococcus sp. HY11]CAH1655272.1 MBL fold metallo-hydrolase [Hyphomicrobiales bacterium]MBX3542249.1 MBL fold metallo-hydrolase [Chelatococcus sp.]MCO5075535.1 MBL fold metallo-hydrolase [Chelatococcus sp.]CAH1695401.1 MBL fold metallo-hydrolase [Hyphomicrobiales bacterium]
MAAGILWLRMPLPLRLNHINIYILDNGDGWTIIDTGYGDDATLSLWDQLLQGMLAEKPVHHIILTHHHPDHMGAAGWLARRTGAQLHMTRTEFLHAHLRASGVFRAHADIEKLFLLAHGMPADIAHIVADGGSGFMRVVQPMPATFARLHDGDVIEAGGRRWTVMTGGGHSDEQAMLYSPDDHILLSGDQVIASITPNLAASYVEPGGSPVDDYIASLDHIKESVGDATLVLSGHKLPFIGIRERIDALVAHHEETFRKICTAVERSPCQCIDLVPLLYRPGLSPHMTGLALAETLAHVNALCRRGHVQIHDSNGSFILRYL